MVSLYDIYLALMRIKQHTDLLSYAYSQRILIVSD